MIQIKKPKPPKILQSKGKAKQKEFCQAYDKGIREFDFDEEKIYNDTVVKETLIKAQHGKCCYCESKFTANSPGDVEHFRPKTAYQQKKGEKLVKPAYYWLAFEWKNLFFSCEVCNRSHKKNLFPLQNPTNRATSHNNDINQEELLFIHPENDNPEAFISFRGVIIFSIDGNQRGIETIKGTGLDRIELEEKRRRHLELLQSLYEVANANPELPTSKRAMEKLKKCASKESEFSSMVKAALTDEFKY